MMESNTKGILLAVLCTLIVSLAQISLKLGSKDVSLSLDQIYNPFLLVGGIFYVFGALVLIWAFRFGELSVVYPIISLSYVLVSLLSIYFLNENLVGYKWIGLGSIVLGVILIGRGGRR